MSRIQRLPFGLLSLFDSKTQGRNPPDFDDNLRLTSDVSEFYLPTLQTLRVTQAAIATTGTFGPITVPFNEIWIVRHIGGRAVFSAGGGNVRLQPQIVPPGQTFALPIGDQVEGALAAAGDQCWCNWWGHAVFKPDTQFQIALALNTLTVTGQVTVGFHQLEA